MVTLEQLHFGVEIEVGSRTRETVARAVQSVVGGPCGMSAARPMIPGP